GENGPLARGERKMETHGPQLIQLQPSFIAPSFGRAWGLPVSSSVPPKRGGVARQSRRQKKERACPARHRLFPLSRSTVPGPGPPLSSCGGCSGARRGAQLRPPPAGAGPAPPLRRLARTPLSGRNDWEYNPERGQFKTLALASRKSYLR